MDSKVTTIRSGFLHGPRKINSVLRIPVINSPPPFREEFFYGVEKSGTCWQEYTGKPEMISEQVMYSCCSVKTTLSQIKMYCDNSGVGLDTVLIPIKIEFVFLQVVMTLHAAFSRNADLIYTLECLLIICDSALNFPQANNAVVYNHIHHFLFLCI